MAGIDKIYTESFYDYYDFRLWCMIYKPSLLIRFYEIDINYNIWEHRKNNAWKAHCKSKLTSKIISEQDFKNNWKVPIADLSFSTINYLKWHCPIPFIRKQLHDVCGVSLKWEWLYKIFWKGKKYFSI